MTPPKFVKNSTDPSFVWIETDDALRHLDGSICDDENGQKFWTVNSKLRKTLSKLREEIECGEKVKVNISSLAKLAEVERVNLYHPRRAWVKEQIDDLNLLKGRLSREKINKEIKEIKELEDLKSRLKLSRQQVAQLTFEKTELLRKLESYERKISMQEKQINKLLGH